MTEDTMIWMEERILVRGGEFDHCSSTLKAMIFGMLVDLSERRLHMYKSDLFHDALWLETKLNGPMEFYWIVRDSGTHMGDEEFVGQVVKAFGSQDHWLYKLKLDNDNGVWVLNVWEYLY